MLHVRMYGIWVDIVCLLHLLQESDTVFDVIEDVLRATTEELASGQTEFNTSARYVSCGRLPLRPSLVGTTVPSVFSQEQYFYSV